jgi:hypothetical protein
MPGRAHPPRHPRSGQDRSPRSGLRRTSVPPVMSRFQTPEKKFRGTNVRELIQASKGPSVLLEPMFDTRRPGLRQLGARFSRPSPLCLILVTCVLIMSEGCTAAALVTGQHLVVVLPLACSTLSIARSLHLVLGQP